MSGTKCRRRWGLMALVLAGIMPASIAPLQAAEPTDTPPVQLVEGRLPVVANEYNTYNAGMVLSTTARRGYQLATGGKFFPPDRVVSYDLDTLSESARSAPLAPTLYEGRNTEAMATVDETGGRLFVAHASTTTNCLGQSCLGGFHVLDSKTLAVRGQIPFLSVPGQGAVLPSLITVSYAPPRSAADRGKLLVLVKERTHGVIGILNNSIDPTYAVQIDAATGTQDWSIRLDACTRTREPAMAQVAGEGAIFRAADPKATVVYATCYGSGGAAQVVRLNVDDQTPANSTQQSFTGPQEVATFIADPARELVLLKSTPSFNRSEAWWVFDGRRSTFVGVLGFGQGSFTDWPPGFDPTTGRLYVLARPRPSSGVAAASEGGLQMADVRRTPLGQSLRFDGFSDLVLPEGNYVPIAVDPAAPGRPRRLFVRPGHPFGNSAAGFYQVIRDDFPISVDAVAEDPDRFTVDESESEGKTSAEFEGTARGFGARMILVGGVEAIPRSSAGDTSLAFRNSLVDAFGPCGPRDRELVLGSVGPSKLTTASSDGQSSAAVADRTTQADAEQPVDRCARSPVPAVTLPQGAPSSAPSLPIALGASECVGGPGQPTESSTVADGLAGFESEASCDDRARGSGRAAAFAAEPVTVAEASSTYSVRRDPQRGVVSVVEAQVRGIRIGPQVEIDSIWTVAESWANGRKQPTTAAADKNCDLKRTAGTCLRRSFGAVRITDASGRTTQFAPGEADAAQLAAAMARALGRDFQVRIRMPDPSLAGGTPGGFSAAIQKPGAEEFADSVLLNDPLLTVPALEIIRTIDSSAGRGRQIFQFAGVELATTYGIQLVPQEEAQPPADLRLELADDAGKPLAGGIFNAYADDDGDGQVGALDKLVEGGTCVTTDDGTGSCEFKGLPPGPYVVQQTAAPSGYQASPDLPLVLESGSLSTATFTNRKAVGVVEVTLSDDASPAKPLADGRFELVADDGDGAVGTGDKTYAECTTDTAGACGFDEVPLGAYVVRQVAAPADYLSAGDAAFALSQPGQTARVGFVTGLAGIAGTDATAGQEVLAEDETPPEEQPFEDPPADAGLEPTSVEVIIEEGPPPPPPVVVATPISEVTPVDRSVGGTLRRLLGAPGELSRFLARNPGEALLFGATWLLLAGAAVLIVRRRSLAAVALTGEPPFDATLLAQQPQSAPPADEVMVGATER